MSTPSNQTRESILRATRDLVVEGRDPTVSMGAIADRAGVSRQAVYLHFESRTDLFLELVAWLDEQFGLARHFEGLDEIADPVDRTAAYARASAAYESKIAEVALALEVARHTDEAAAAAWEDRMSRRRAMWRRAFEAIADDERLREEWSPERASEAFWSISAPSAYRQLVHDCDWTPDQYADWIEGVLRDVFVTDVDEETGTRRRRAGGGQRTGLDMNYDTNNIDDVTTHGGSTTGTAKTETTRDRIMRGLAEELLDSGPHEVTIQAVADRAGVSHRTVYRYFDTKADLFHAYGEWVDEVTTEREQTAPNTLRGLETQIRKYNREFDEHAELMEAYVRIGRAGHEIEVQNQRTEQFNRAVREALPTLESKYQRAVATIIRQIASSQTWARAREDFDVDGETLGEVASRLVGAINDTLEAGDLPEGWKVEE